MVAIGGIISVGSPPGSGTGSTTVSSGVQKFSAAFVNITSGIFQHGLGSRAVMVQVHDNSGPPEILQPDRIVFDTLDHVSLLFNRRQSGTIVVIG